MSARMSIAIFYRAIGAGLSLIVNIVIARKLGSSGAGIFFLVLTIVTAASVISRFGLDQIFLRYAGAEFLDKLSVRFHTIYRSGIYICVVIGGVTTFSIVFLMHIIPINFSGVYFNETLSWMALAILPLALGVLFCELLKGIKESNSALFLQFICAPLILLVFLIIGEAWNPQKIAIIFVTVNFFVFIGSCWVWYSHVDLSSQMKELDLSGVARESIPLLVVAITNFALSWTDTLMLGYFGTSSDIGVYGMAMRYAVLPSFFLVATASIVAPRLAELHAAGDRDGMEYISRKNATVMTALALPAVLGIIVYSREILGFAGMDFERGAMAMVILALGQFSIVCTGPGGFLLSMTGHLRSLRNINIFGAFLNIVLNLVLIPQLGIIGAAIATSSSLAIMNAILFTRAKQLLAVNSLPYLWSKL